MIKAILYDMAFLIFSIFYLPTLIFRGKLHKDFLERFGIYGADKTMALSSAGATIWIQAVSVGEVALCKNLIPLLRERFSDSAIVLSTITKAGNDLAKRLFRADATIIYFPLDFSFCVKRALGLMRPRLYIMVETEIWPNLLAEAARRRIPSALINGRISDKSFGKYMLAKPFLKEALGAISVFCMQSETDAERMKTLGAPQGKVRVTGSMKFDARIAQDAGSIERFRRSLGLSDGELLVAGSTHRGEEEAVLEVFAELRRQFPGLRLLIAPRHIDRVGEIESIAKRFGFESERVSHLLTRRTAPDARRVLVLDTIGQLNDIYAVSALVFIGGSLVRHGGQNPIEPAAFEKAVIFGPHMFNFKAIASTLLENGGAIQISDKKELLKKCALLLGDAQERLGLGRNAKRVVLEGRGATERNLAAISEVLT